MTVISRTVERGSMVYIQAAASEPAGDIKAQTRQVLERIDHQLALAGSGKSKLLTAKVRLSDVNLTDAHNAVWNEWLDGHRPPLRACVRGVLPRPEMLVEIMVTAVK